MKTQIVNIDPHDDYGSIRDKLLWTKAVRIILVWPGRGEVLNSRLDLVLLKRLGQQRGIAIGLLTFDPQVRSYASELSIPLFENLENLPESSWALWQYGSDEPIEEHTHREIPRPEHQTAAIRSPQHPLLRLLILLFPITVFLLALILLLPSAEIELHPVALREIETLSFTLAEESDFTNLSLRHDVRELEVQGELRIPTSGRGTLPDQAAHGEVVFTNLTEDPVTIPADTSVRCSSFESMYFQTDGTVHLDGGEGEQVFVSVTAASTGPDGNLAEGTVDTLDGNLGLILSVTNPEPMSGGSLQTRAAVSAIDVRRIQDQLQIALEEEFISRMGDVLLPHERMLESSYQIVEVLYAVYDAEIGDVADSLSLDLTLLVSISVIDIKEVQQISSSRLESNLPPGYIFITDSPEVRAIQDSYLTNTDEISVDVDLLVRSFLEIDIQALKEIVRGTRVDELEDELRSIYSGDLSPGISLTPSWWPRLPFFEHQIDVNIILEDAA